MSKKRVWRKAVTNYLRSCQAAGVRTGLGMIVFMLLTACDPPWSAPDTIAPLAFRSAGGQSVETLLTRCSDGRLRRFEVFEGDGIFRGDERVIWALDFTATAPDTPAITLGQVPAGATAQVPWAGLGGDRAQRYVVRASYDDGKSWFMSFALADLDGGKVRFNSQSIPSEQFANTNTCERPG